jgi:hypothetical protein
MDDSTPCWDASRPAGQLLPALVSLALLPVFLFFCLRLQGARGDVTMLIDENNGFDWVRGWEKIVIAGAASASPTGGAAEVRVDQRPFRRWTNLPAYKLPKRLVLALTGPVWALNCGRISWQRVSRALSLRWCSYEHIRLIRKAALTLITVILNRFATFTSWMLCVVMSGVALFLFRHPQYRGACECSLQLALALAALWINLCAAIVASVTDAGTRSAFTSLAIYVPLPLIGVSWALFALAFRLPRWRWWQRTFVQRPREQALRIQQEADALAQLNKNAQLAVAGSPVIPKITAAAGGGELGIELVRRMTAAAADAESESSAVSVLPAAVGITLSTDLPRPALTMESSDGASVDAALTAAACCGHSEQR